MWCKDKLIWFWTEDCTECATRKEQNTVHNGINAHSLVLKNTVFMGNAL